MISILNEFLLPGAHGWTASHSLIGETHSMYFSTDYGLIGAQQCMANGSIASMNSEFKVNGLVLSGADNSSTAHWLKYLSLRSWLLGET